MIDPVGAYWWWHLSPTEQQMHRLNAERAEEIKRELEEIRREQRQIRTVAKNRCAAMADHSHSMVGLYP